MAERVTFKCTIMTPDALLYEKDVYSVFLTGDKGEYELMPYHYPVLGILKEGNIIINWQESISIKMGLVRFFANDCIVLVEQEEHIKRKKEKKEVDIVFSDDKDQ